MDVGPAAVWQLQDQALPLSRVLPSSAEGGHTFRSALGPRVPYTTDMQGVIASITDTLAPNHKNIR